MYTQDELDNKAAYATQRWIDGYVYRRNSAVRLSVCLSVCLSALQNGEPIEMLFGTLIRVGPENHELDGSPDPQT